MKKKYKSIATDEFIKTLFDNKNTDGYTLDFYADYDSINDETQWAYRAKIINFADSMTLLINYFGGGALFAYDFNDEISDTTFNWLLTNYLRDNGFMNKEQSAIWIENNCGTK